MKLLLLSLFLVGAGAGGYGLSVEATDAPAPLPLDTCSVDCPPGRMTIERVAPDTCQITCYDESNEIRCQEEVVCDETDRPCDRPCERVSSCSR